jgi:alpha-L-rhamnosidase
VRYSVGSSNWSEPSSFSTAIDGPSFWDRVPFIGSSHASSQDCPWFRRSFLLSSDSARSLASGGSALAYVASAGYHELYVNGLHVRDDVLAPSTVDLAKRIRYRSYNVTSFLKQGGNVIAVWLAPGWSLFRGVNPVVDYNLTKAPLFAAQLHLFSPADKQPTMVVSSDTLWRTHLSTTRHLGQWTSGDFGGDAVDLRADMPGWNNVSFDDRAWDNATVFVLTPARAVSSDTVEPTRVRSTVAAASVAREILHGRDTYLVTMETLYTGWIEIDVVTAPNSTVRLEISTNQGTQMEYNMADEIIVGSSGCGTFCNRFSYHEIQYVTIIGLVSAPSLSSIRGYRVGTDRVRSGSFSCSNALLTSIYTTTMYNYEGLTTGGMTVDCPHRERLGYGGDGHTSMEAALFNYPSQPFFSKWAEDWGDIQQDNGYIAHTAPTIDGGGGPAWSGFVVTMPWQVYIHYGDTRILEHAFPHMMKLLAFFESKRDSEGILQNWGDDWAFLGDWLTPHGSEQSDSIEAVLFNNCYVLYCTQIAENVARLLGDDSTANEFATRVIAQSAAIVKRFFNSSTALFLDSLQSHLVLPLVSSAVPPSAVASVESNLRNEISVSKSGHLDTGLHGTYFMTKYLSENSFNDLIYLYASQDTFPSYGHFFKMGYTTWPEQWDGAKSRMHGCYNGIGAWFHAGLLGIRPDPSHPGMQDFIVRPAAEVFSLDAGSLSWATGNITTAQGVVAVAWSLDPSPLSLSHPSPDYNLTYPRPLTHISSSSARVGLTVTVPPNAAATVFIPARSLSDVTEGGVAVGEAVGVTVLHVEAWAVRPSQHAVGPNAVVVHIGSGMYSFSSLIDL